MLNVALLIALVFALLWKPGCSEARNTSLPAIGTVIVINLNRSVNRMQHMDQLLKKMRVPYERFNAIDFQNGTDLAYMEKIRQEQLHADTRINYTMVDNAIRDMKEPWLNWNSIGCWQSHLQVYMNIWKGKYSHLRGPYLILEDDIEISSRIYDILSYEFLYSYLPEDWDTLHLDHFDLKCHENDFRKPEDTIPWKQYCLVNHLLHLGGYVIRSPKVAQTLAEHSNTPQHQIAHYYINAMFEYKVIRAYSMLKFFIRQNRKMFTPEI